MIYNIDYYLPIGIFILNFFILLKKTKIIYTKILIIITNFWLILYLINNYFEIRIYFFSLDSMLDRNTIISILFHSFLLLSISTLLYNLIIELLKKFYKNCTIDYTIILSNTICLVAVYFIYDWLIYIVDKNLENVDLQISIISTLLFVSLFLIGNSILTIGLNLAKDLSHISQ